MMKKMAILATALSVFGVLALGGTAAATKQLTMSPGSSENIILEPGMQQHGDFMIYNTGDEAVEIKVLPTELCVNDSYNYTFEGCGVATSTTIKNWITVSAEKTLLQPREETKVSYVVNVPRMDLPGGSQHAGITVLFEGESTAHIGADYVLGYKLFAYNPVGADLRADLLSAGVSRLQFKKPLKAQMTAKNEGNIDFFAKTKLTVSKLGGEMVYQSDDPAYVVLPGTTRTVANSWEGAPHLGFFRVKYEVVLESIDGAVLETKTIEHLVLMMPLLMFIIILVVIAALVIFLVVRVRRSRELKNARRY